MSREVEQPPLEPVPEGKYVYCIIETAEPRSFGPMGIGGRGDDVYTVRHKGLAAVVKDEDSVLNLADEIVPKVELDETIAEQWTLGG